MSTAQNQTNVTGPLSVSTLTWQDLFLMKYAETMNMKASADFAGVSRQTVFNYTKKDPDFSAKVQMAKQDAIDTLEMAVLTRARDGVERVFPAWYKGVRIGERVERQFSDGLAEFWLKHHRPEVYNPAQVINHTITIDETDKKLQLTQAVQFGINSGMSLSDTLNYLIMRGVSQDDLKLVQGSDLQFPDISNAIEITCESDNSD